MLEHSPELKETSIPDAYIERVCVVVVKVLTCADMVISNNMIAE
jgi:hypothetical protein